VEQVKADKEQLKSDLTFLTSQIGPRLTGSPQVDRANHWTEEQFRALGLENAQLESWSIANHGPGACEWACDFAGTARIDASDGGMVAEHEWHGEGRIGRNRRGKTGGSGEVQGEAGRKDRALWKTARMEPPIDPILTRGKWTLPLMHPKEDKPFDFRAYAATRRAAHKDAPG